MNRIFPCIAVYILASTIQSPAQRLDKFVSETGKSVRMSKEKSIPYDQVITYFGYIKPGSEPDERRNDKNFYYLYFWLPDSVSEIGLRMISPVPDVVMPDRGDLTSRNYFENEKDKVNYFDTWISLERAGGIFKTESIPAMEKNIKWIQLASNDDSPELFAQPSGNNYNSLFRILNKSNDKKKLLLSGLYRVAFTTFKKGEVKGSYVLQLGMTTKFPGMKLVEKMEELQ